jgi:ribosomal protein L19E
MIQGQFVFDINKGRDLKDVVSQYEVNPLINNNVINNNKKKRISLI